MAYSTDVDRGWAWIVAAGSLIIHTFVVGIAWSTGVYNVIFLDVFNDSETVTAWAGTLSTALQYGTGPLSSALTNKFGCRPISMVGGAVGGAGLMLCYFAPNIYYLYFFFGIMTGFGFGLAYIPAIASVALYFEKYRGIATGIAVSGVGVGTFIFPPIITYLHHLFDWRSSLLILGALSLNITVCGALIRPVNRVELRQEKTILFDMSILKNSHYIILCLACTLFAFGISIIYLHLVALARANGISENNSSMLMSYIGISNILGRFALGSLGNHPRVNVVVLYSVGFILAGISACFYPLIIHSYTAAVIVSSLFGFITGVYGAVLPLVLVFLVGIRKMTNAYGYLLVLLAVGQLLGGPFSGFLFETTQSYNCSFFVGGSVLIVGSAMTLTASYRKKVDENVAFDLEFNPEEKNPLPIAS